MSAGLNDPRIQTVTGALPAAVIDGQILPHEHLRTDTRWGIGVDSDPGRWLDEESYVTAELKRQGREHELTLVVDHTGLGAARDAAALARVSAGSRVAVVAATGYAAEPFAGDLIRRFGVDDLTGDLLHEIGAGLDGTSSRPGLIVAAAWQETPTTAEERATVAAARAAIRTGLPLAAHGPGGLSLLETLLTSGVPAARVSVRTGDQLVQRKIAESGCYVSVTAADDVLALLEAGHAARTLLSSGVGRQRELAGYGGDGYARLFHRVLPALTRAGVDPATLRLITRENPLRWLAVPGTR
ncbi:aryldialkylphosphatase [Acrocarpospora catenulata]|uniref:phosphotriesterase family protein n=1 Tax=Acrocarpospora catenulata TaxID=2836182 RepID=UPI001BDA2528|nr:aryldialkylphosphatase [Acrocarpospora catenulata]